ncbi:MAG: lipoprotein-releasing system ATP-binding protein [Candidatus Paceibacteria bacterium]|jgi:lipoprotein-releasing system ATP-binding protein|tara:strand:+ start:6666 stop:7343 length:678 start_codon:yes stop_codon:yes gene_type:complete
MSNWVLQASGLVKSFTDGDRQVDVLKGLNLQLAQAQSMAIIGSSGSGKSTLLQLLAGLEQPNEGKVMVVGQCLSDLNGNQAAKLRNQHLGFVFQFHHLLAEFSALENVMLPYIIAGNKPNKAQQKALSMLTRVGLADRASHKPGALSGGERQRVAIARALINEPACLLMDEPTGNLDRHNAEQTLTLLKQLQVDFGTAFVAVTHDLSLASQLDTQLSLKDGQLVS